MIMIVYHHFYVHGNWEFPEAFSKKAFLIQTLGNYGRIGVIIFILITGYFMTNQTFRIKKVFALTNVVRYYSIIALIVLIFIGGEFNREVFFNSMFPVVFQQYWFVNAYLILIIMQPILKSFFINQDRTIKLEYFIVISLLLYIPSFVGILFNLEQAFTIDQTLAFIMIAYAGHLIKEYSKELRTKYFKFVVLAFVITWSLIILRPILMKYGMEMFAFDTSFLVDINSLNALIFSSSLFIIVQNLKIPSFPFIFSVAPLVFDVYLIHDNRIIRSLIWQTIFKNPESFSLNFFPVIALVEPMIVFIVCLLMAKIRVNMSSLIIGRLKSSE